MSVFLTSLFPIYTHSPNCKDIKIYVCIYICNWCTYIHTYIYGHVYMVNNYDNDTHHSDLAKRPCSYVYMHLHFFHKKLNYTRIITLGSGPTILIDPFFFIIKYIHQLATWHSTMDEPTSAFGSHLSWPIFWIERIGQDIHMHKK